MSYGMGDNIVAKAALASLEGCKKDHKRCASGPAPPLPLRVIDVGSPDQDIEPRLQISRNSETGLYACLSYCWGGVQEYMTTQATIESYIQSLKLSDLAKTIQDAIKVTRMLQLRYLWIDALCIIQDGVDDKKKEMAYMGEIYKNSTVTIAASRTKSVHEGFLDNWSAHDKPAILPFMGPSKDLTGSIKIVKTNFFDTTVWPLDSRAWALQEYLLSPRLLIFGTGGPVWQCQSQNLRPIIPSNSLFNMDLQRLPDAIFLGPVGGRASIPSHHHDDWHTAERQQQHLTWKTIVENYSARQISFPSDRLPAITGVTSELSRIWNDRCHFGMWQSNLFQQLVWFAETPQRKANAAPVPSWSWLRVNTGVKHLDYSPEFEQNLKRPPLSEMSRFIPRGGFHVEDNHLIVDDADCIPANEMMSENRKQMFKTIPGSRNFKWLDKFLTEKSKYDLVGDHAVFMDFDREPESWFDQVAYLTLGSFVGATYNYGP
jgi:Heterokaryon incompatibility protein (HET)